ncbi:hypothetical protein CLV59_1011056 [Chitinophaga dinghuensis]|uniref:Uncharacterized protein n=1 Tax=Chitinophaga dinghuensis TaxID=1539050 RepID=A0A327WFZ7_9BACT|nr:hypothetical protein [Chitinophaga dinghuensis]RAJ88286.1 hypothetical protein CLV59_1011056 [Chitinophaga dinghuensis]
MTQNSRLQVSEKFYFEQELIPGLYIIGNWGIQSRNTYEGMIPTHFYEILQHFLSFFPWLEILKVSMACIDDVWESKSSAYSLKEWCIQKDQFFAENKLLITSGMDIATVDLNYRMSYNDIPFSFNEQGTGYVYIMLDDNGGVYASLNLIVDVFHKEPKDTSKLKLTQHQAEHNNNLLTHSLREIEASGLYEIEVFESDLYSQEIHKYGFQCE